MRFVVATYGTEGDTRPLVGVCAGLQASGHAVTLLAERSTLGPAQDHAIPCHALVGDLKGEAEGAFQRVMSKGDNVQVVLRTVAQIANDNAQAWMADLLEHSRGADAILFSGLASYVGLAVGEHLGIPAIGLGLWPISPTREFVSPLLPQSLPRWLAKPSHRLVNAMMWRMFRDSLNHARAKVFGAKPRSRMWSGYPLAYGVSPSLVPQPADWPAQWRVCGAWSSPVPAGWQPDPALEDFLAAGPKPIYFGFGSMAGFDRRPLLDAMVSAAKGRRAVMFPGWSGIEASDLPANFRMVGAMPHQWLFPRMAVVVHHGGAGTTHTAAGAGVPSVVVPFAADQFFWADRLARIGCAPAPVKRARLDGEALGRSLDAALGMQEKAAALADRMVREDGVGEAVRFVERWSHRS